MKKINSSLDFSLYMASLREEAEKLLSIRKKASVIYRDFPTLVDYTDKVRTLFGIYINLSLDGVAEKEDYDNKASISVQVEVDDEPVGSFLLYQCEANSMLIAVESTDSCLEFGHQGDYKRFMEYVGDRLKDKHEIGLSLRAFPNLNGTID